MVKLTKAKKYRAIKWYVERGYKANDIQKRLSERGLGVRRKNLLAEIRSIKEIQITAEKRIKHVPKKYRKKIIPRERWIERGRRELEKPIYRISLIIPSLPVHSLAFRRNYLGFRLNAFSYDKGLLSDKIRELKEILIKETGKYVDSLAYAREQIIRIESPTIIKVLNPNYLNGKWFFAVEKEGKEQYTVSGYL